MKNKLIKSIIVSSFLVACTLLCGNNVQATVNGSNGSFSYTDCNGWWGSKGYDANKVTGRVVSGDFNGDGKTDIATFYDYGNGAARIHVFCSNGSSFDYSNGNGWWQTPSGYDLNHVSSRVVAGDFDGDGKADIAAIYDYGNGAARIHVFKSTGSSFTYDGPSGWWSTPNGYDVNKITGRVVAGDFNGDGKADIAAMYDYGNGAARIHVFKSTGSSFTYDNGANGWWSTPNGYDVNKVTGRLVAGDFNGDGKTDIAAMFDYGNGQSRIHMFKSTGSSFTYDNGANGWWSTPSNSGYDVNKVTGRVVAGDFNGDGLADIAAVYDYGNTASRIHVFTSTGSSFSYTDSNGWWATSSGYDANKITGRVVAGDFNGNKVADIAAMYDYGNAESRIHVFTSSWQKQSSKGQEIADYSKQFINTPYLWGGTTPAGFDCSGFTQYVYAHFGITIPRTSQEQATAGIAVTGALQPGDLLFFEPSSNGPQHVGMYIGNGQMIESPHTGSYIHTSNVRPYCAARRIIQ